MMSQQMSWNSGPESTRIAPGTAFHKDSPAGCLPRMHLLLATMNRVRPAFEFGAIFIIERN